MISLRDLFYPSYCINCKRKADWLCDSCKNTLKPSIPECYICRRISNGYTTHENCLKQSSPRISKLVYLWQYDKVASQLISKYKYKSAYLLTDTIFKSISTSPIFNTTIKSIEKPLLVPIPIHYKRNFKRGFNQSLLISEKISKFYNLDICKDELLRSKNTKSQATLHMHERKHNVIDAFTIDNPNQLLKFTNLILFDDVITTGKTIEAAARAIRAINPTARIHAVGLFRGRPYYDTIQ